MRYQDLAATRPVAARPVLHALAASIAALALAAPPARSLARDLQPADPGLLQSAIARAGAEGGLVALIVVRTEEPLEPGLLEVLRDPRTEQALSRCVPLVLAVDRQPAIAARYGVRRLPVAVFLDGSGREVGRVAGLSDPAEFAERAAEIVADAAAGPALHSGPGRDEEADPAALVAAAERRRSAGDRLEAVSLFMRALERLERARAPLAGWPPEAARSAARAHLGLGDNLRQSGRPGEAAAHYRSALAALEAPEGAGCPLRGQAALGLAVAERASGRPEEAVRGLDAALQEERQGLALEGSPRERALFFLGRLLAERGQEGAAQERFEECTHQFPGGRYASRARRYLAVAPAASAPRVEPAPSSR